ncbi:TonB-dependent receptor domain-containing protein [Longibacter sp.]|jgi:outer membrane receptor protein involved in Fe transport|uniref:TonB-dependent receptor domain-containing protein n=1 Tax=Longibacter sp. TaxID=2045415 RepID=UPI003EB7CC8C
MNQTTRYLTRAWQAALWLLAGCLVLSATTAVAQQTEESLLANSSPTIEERNAEISLEEALTRISNLHGVSFLYRPEQITGKVVHRRKALPARLDGQLDRILAPHGLTHTKVGSQSYAIVPVQERMTPATREATEPMQTGTVQGTVRDQSGPLPGVQVVLQGTTRGDVSAPDGSYEIAEVPAGDYTLQAKFVGYATQTVDITVEADETVTQDVTMTQDVMQMEGAVVTGTRSERTQRETTSSISVIGAEELETIQPNSQADILRSVPGVHTEGGGGAVAANVFVRGLPAPGQYKYNPIEENGMPVISETRTTTSAQDIFFRYDQNVERLEFVRGGSSALFGVGSPAGIINYISKTGGSTQETTIKATAGQNNLYRLDFNTNGPIGDNFRFNLGGFYRYDEGPVVTGLPTQGGQIKGNLTYLQDNGYIRIYGKYMNDAAQFFLPFYYNTSTKEAADGIDGAEWTTISTPDAADFNFNTPDGRFESQMEDGITARGGNLMIEFYRDLGSGFSLENKARYTSMDHVFNIFIPFGATTPQAFASDFINGPDQAVRYRYARGTEGQFGDGTYSGSGPGVSRSRTDLIVNQGAWNWSRPYTDVASQIEINKSAEVGSSTHNITFGAFLSRTDVEQTEIYSSTLAEFADQPRFLDAQLVDTQGTSDTSDDVVLQDITRDGLSNASTNYVNNQITSNKIAGFFGDEIEFENLRVDLGFRYGIRSAEWAVEGTEAIDTGDELAQQDIQWGNGEFTRTSLYSTDWAASLGLNYQVTETANLYAVGSRGYFFPEIASLTTGDPVGDLTNEKFYQGEFGVKLASQTISGSLALYYTNLQDRFAADQREDPATGQIRTVANRVGGSQTLGAELSGAVLIPTIDGLRVNYMATYQDHEYTDFTQPGEDGTLGTGDDIDLSGNEIRRQPNILGQLGLQYSSTTFDGQVSAKYTGERFGNDINTQVLDPYTIVNLDAGYTVQFDDEQTMRLGVNVFNLLNSRGLTEGNPRLAPGTDPSDQPYFIARPILPRRVKVSLTYSL